jgi:hypothetical protein
VTTTQVSPERILEAERESTAPAIEWDFVD